MRKGKYSFRIKQLVTYLRSRQIRSFVYRDLPQPLRDKGLIQKAHICGVIRHIGYVVGKGGGYRIWQLNID